MTVDQNFIPNDLRPLTIARPLPADDPRAAALFFPPSAAGAADPVYASLAYPLPPAPAWASARAPPPPAAEGGEEREPPAAAGGRKVKLLCGCGGRILPRPSDGALRYVGGQTRIIGVRRDVGFPEFMAKMAEVYGPSAAVKYQLPDEDLDALVSVSCGEDLENMMEEYEKLADASPDGSAKLRVFVFPAADLDSPASANFGDAADSNQRYVEAVNGIADAAAANPFAAFRPGNAKESSASASSAHSDVDLGESGASSSQVECEPPGGAAPPPVPAAGVVLPHDGARVVYLPVSLPAMGTAAEAAGYHQPYLDPHGSARVVYANPPPVGVVGAIYRDSMLGVPPAPVAVQMANGPASPGAGLRGNGGQQFVHRIDPHYVDESAGIGSARVVQVPAYQLMASQILPPASVHRPVPPRPPLPPEQLVKLDECNMCQKQLPHAHSDSVLQEPVNVISKTISEPTQFFQSNVSDEDGRCRNQFRVVATGGMSEDGVERPPVEWTSKLGGVYQCAAAQPWLVVHSEPSVQEVIPQPLSSGVIGTVTTGNSIPVRTAPLQHLDGFARDPAFEYQGKVAGVSPKEGVADSCSYNDLARPLDAKLEALHVNPPEVVEQYRSTLQAEIVASKGVIAESGPAVVNAGARLVEAASVGNASAFVVQPGVLSDGIYVRPVELRPSNLDVPANLHSYQAVEPNRISPPSETSGNLKVDFVPSVTGDMWHAMPPLVSGFDSTHLTGEKIPMRVVSDVPSFPVGTSLAAVSTALPGVIGENWNPASSNTLFSSQDPWNLIQQAQQSHYPPPRPNKIVGKDPFAGRDPVSEAFIMTNGAEPNSRMVVEEVLVHQPTEPLNQGSVEEQIKQDLKAVAEGVAASVLQSSMNLGPLSSAHHLSQPDDQLSHGGDILEDNGEAQNQDLKSKQLDKVICGLQITEDISRLQIIKNSDLEELRELGSGTFGTVYHGKWKGTDVAIKRINDRCFAGKPSEQERLRADFWNEACKLADLHHPNVVAFYGVVLDGPGESVATVTEYMVNGSLRHALQRNDRTLDRRKRLLIAMDVAFGMEYLHEKNIVHFDLKSDNLLVNLRDPHRPICKVGDLGLSKVKCQTLISGGVRGTLPWMAPELLNGSSSLVSEKVDVFSFGIVMWELLTGEEPYADLHYGAIIGGIVNNTLRPPVPETCDPEWKSLMERCWASEPSERPSFMEIASKLRAMAASLPPKEKPISNKNEVKGL